MTCKELVELVTDYLEHTLSEVDRARFEAHLETCDGCTRYIAQMRLTIHLIGEVPEETLSEPAKAELLRIFRDWKSR